MIQVKDWDETGEEQSIGRVTVPFSSLEVTAQTLRSSERVPLKCSTKSLL